MFCTFHVVQIGQRVETLATVASSVTLTQPLSKAEESVVLTGWLHKCHHADAVWASYVSDPDKAFQGVFHAAGLKSKGVLDHFRSCIVGSESKQALRTNVRVKTNQKDAIKATSGEFGLLVKDMAEARIIGSIGWIRKQDGEFGVDYLKRCLDVCKSSRSQSRSRFL